MDLHERVDCHHSNAEWQHPFTSDIGTRIGFVCFSITGSRTAIPDSINVASATMQLVVNGGVGLDCIGWNLDIVAE
jgi:hypothetical protein